MAGHSQFKNIMHRKGAQDAKRAKAFAKLIRELTVASREGGPEPDGNPRLRAAIGSAKASNLPKDTMAKAIRRGAGDLDGDHYETIRYEGYAAGGVAFIIEALTDNRNRTASDVRSAFSKYGGTLAESNSVVFQFKREGSVRYPLDRGNAEYMLDIAIEVGADEVITSGDDHEFFCLPESFYSIRTLLEKKLSLPLSAELTWRPINTVTINGQQTLEILKLIEALDEIDGVQTISSNFEVPDEILQKVSA